MRGYFLDFSVHTKIDRNDHLDSIISRYPILTIILYYIIMNAMNKFHFISNNKIFSSIPTLIMYFID